MPRITKEIGQELVVKKLAVEAIQDSKARKAALRQLKSEYGWSDEIFYKILHQYGWKSARKERVDKGLKVWGKDKVEFMAKCLLESKRKDKHMIVPIETVLDIMVENGLITPEERISPATAARYLRESGLSKRQMMGELDGRSVHNTMRSLYPNHLHQFDITNCVQYFFEKEGIRRRQ